VEGCYGLRGRLVAARIRVFWRRKSAVNHLSHILLSLAISIRIAIRSTLLHGLPRVMHLLKKTSVTAHRE